MTATQKTVPALRFPEFKGSFFFKYEFEEIFNFSTGKNIKQNEASPEFETPCVRYGELYHMYGEVIDEVINKTNLDRNELKFSLGNEILLPSAGEDPLDICSASALTIPDVAIGRTINILTPKNDSIYSQIFASYYINTKLRKKISSLAKGVSISNVYNSDLKGLKINLPPLSEQQKIASFLVAVDKKIKAFKKQKEALAKYKKGVMQKIFSQEIRFKDENGKEFPKWEEKAFGKIFSFKITNSFSRTMLNYEEGEVRNIHYGDIHTQFQSQFDITRETVPFVNSEVNLANISSDNYCIEGDLIIADASEDYKDIGKAIEVMNLNGQKVIAGLHTLLARDENNVMAKGFSGYLMQSYNVRLQIMRQANGISVLGISKSNLSTVKIPVPQKQEQEKIATFLSSLDQKIENLEKQISSAEQWKKGLLEKMFI